MNRSSRAVRFLYSTVPGRLLLRGIMASHVDHLAVAFLRSRLSRPLIAPYARLCGMDAQSIICQDFRTYRDFFARSRSCNAVDTSPEHLISPCDGWLSAYPITENSSFSIKNSHYCIGDFLQDKALAQTYRGGDCLIFRLCPSDYHHYCYIDNCYQGINHFIPGVLHSVQPIACEHYPVYVLNRRSWTLLSTENFGPVVQTEIGALIVGGICNPRENIRARRGQEKGHFELAGSTIVLLFQKGAMCLRPDILEKLKYGEVRMRYGMWIGNALKNKPTDVFLSVFYHMEFSSQYCNKERGGVSMNLTEAKEGAGYTVTHIQTDDDELNAFLFSLGCYSGEAITLVSRQRGNFVIAVKDGRYSIDPQLAAAIIID